MKIEGNLLLILPSIASTPDTGFMIFSMDFLFYTFMMRLLELTLCISPTDALVTAN